MAIKLELPYLIAEGLENYSLEGIDGSGKSTQSRLIVARLREEGINAVPVSSPRHDLYGENLRSHVRDFNPRQRQALFLHDMLETMAEQEPDTLLIWDRYIHSSLVSNIDGSTEEIEAWTNNLLSPRASFWLDVRPEVVVQSRGQSLHDHSVDIAWQQVKYDRYERLLETDPRLVRIDGTQPTKIIAEEISKIILSRTDLWQH